MPTSLKFVHTINAPAPLVYRAFTNATALREWLCDVATVDPKVGGHIFLAWNSGYYACGEFIKLIPEREATFIWSGRDDPAPTTVSVHINALDSGATTLSVEHTGLESSPQWARASEEISRGWNNGLRNLISVLEVGPDLRIVNRPMMGIMFGDFNKKRADELGVPVTEGMRLEGTVDGMGAQKCGLVKNDVIISMNGKPTPDFASVTNILQGLEAGNSVEVVIYRGAEKKRLSMELSRRPLPDIPRNTQALGETLAKMYDQVDGELKQALEGVTEEEASFKPRPDDWCVKEVIAHLIHGERDTQGYISELYFSQERTSDGFIDNLPSRISATVACYPTLGEILEELFRSERETVHIVGNLPEEFNQNKASYWRLAFNMLQFPIHNREHINQINDVLQAARKKG